MAENKMEQVAAMFGKKLGEDFRIRYKDFSSRGRYEDVTRRACFNERGLYVYWYKDVRDNLLIGLITGGAVIVDD